MARGMSYQKRRKTQGSINLPKAERNYNVSFSLSLLFYFYLRVGGTRLFLRSVGFMHFLNLVALSISKGYDWLKFNRRLLSIIISSNHQLTVTIDVSFISKVACTRPCWIVSSAVAFCILKTSRNLITGSRDSPNSSPSTRMHCCALSISPNLKRGACVNQQLFFGTIRQTATSVCERSLRYD